MAEELLRQAFISAGKLDCFVNSAGLTALVGHKAEPSACRVMIEKGLDISAHRACQLNTEMIRKSDLILVMESCHKTAVEKKEPSAKGKVFRLGEWGKFDIGDPYRKQLPAFERSLTLIELGISQWIKKLV
jgi:protein-tyrosine phosphatase